MSKKQKESLVPLISTIIVAALAIVMAIAAILILKGGNDTDNTSGGMSGATSDTVFQPSDDFKKECEFAIESLIIGNSRVISLFVTNGLPYESEPYGNLPEDGLYTVSSTEYKTIEQIETLLKSIYVEEEVQRILTNIDGNGLAVYQNRKKLVKVEDTSESTAESTSESSIQYDTEYVLGISSSFTPDTDYSKDWTDLNFGYEIISETECNITIYFGGYNPAVGTAEPLPDQVLDMTMVKVGDVWRLKALVY